MATQTPDKGEDRIRCHGGVSVLCLPVAPAVSSRSNVYGKRDRYLVIINHVILVFMYRILGISKYFFFNSDARVLTV